MSFHVKNCCFLSRDLQQLHLSQGTLLSYLHEESTFLQLKIFTLCMRILHKTLGPGRDQSTKGTEDFKHLTADTGTGELTESFQDMFCLEKDQEKHFPSIHAKT
ncbi:Protein myomaker [Manis javanica]|nr:Protein myomaker [Manis javanica]